MVNANMPAPGRAADDDWFSTNAPTDPSYQRNTANTNFSQKPTTQQLDAAYQSILGRARDQNDTQYLNDPNYISNLSKTQEAANYAAGPQSGAGSTGSASSSNLSPQDFIKQWQQTHAANEGMGPLADAMKAAGYSNVSRFMYGSTPSNNELSIDGQKYKVISGEDSSNPSWYAAGTNDGGQNSQAFTPPAAWNESFTSPSWDKTFEAPTSADFAGDSAYQEQLARGQDALQKSAAARGTVLNPGTLKDLSDWTVGAASAEGDKLYNRKASEYSQQYGQYLNTVQQKANDYQQRYNQYLNAYQQAAGTFGINYGVATDDINRFMNQQNTAFNQNMSLAQLGMQGANNATNAGQNYATQGSNAITGGANAQAGGVVGGANAWNGATGTLSNIGTSLYGLSRYGNPYGGYTGNSEGYQW